MKPTFIALLALFLSLPLVAADKDKPLPKDFKSLKALAEKGDAKAQNSLGWIYQSGEGVEQDYAKALEWFTKSAEQNNPFGQSHLGRMYNKGQGVEQHRQGAPILLKLSFHGVEDLGALVGVSRVGVVKVALHPPGPHRLDH